MQKGSEFVMGLFAGLVLAALSVIIALAIIINFNL